MEQCFDPSERQTVFERLNKLVQMELFPEQFPQLTEEHLDRVRNAVNAIEQTLDDVEDILQSGQEQVAGDMVMSL